MKKSFLSLGLGSLLCLGSIFLNPNSAFAIGAFEATTPELKFVSPQPMQSRDLSVRSIGDESVAIQVRFISRKQNLDGTEIDLDDDPEADNSFLSYPPQVIVKPGEEQTIRVMWLGGKGELTEEIAYRVILEQVPVDLKPISITQGERSLSVKVLTRYSIPVYITPDGATPKVVIESINHIKSEGGKDQLILDMQNQGTAHLKFSPNFRLSLKSSQGKTIVLTGEQVKEVIGENILAGNKRRFVLPWPEELPVGPVTATFTTN